MTRVFTNGCFDILHRGHVELLKYSKSLGNYLIVGLNTDRSVRALKGEKRPINSEQDRKLLLESLRCVDEVILFDEETPRDLILSLKPDIIVKGGDYNVESVIGADIAKVVIFKYLDGYSTTKIIKSISSW